MSETEGVLASEDTRQAAAYLVECALPAGASIVKNVGGEQIVLEGYIGLAPQWEDGSCDQECQEWVSACLLARTNVSTRSVPISLRADHPAIGFAGHPSYTVYEASFFGNVFAQREGSYLCGSSEAAAAIAQAAGRTCSSNPASCGMVGFDDCEEEERCELVEEDDGVTAIDCMPKGSNHEYRTISVYVAGPGNGND